MEEILTINRGERKRRRLTLDAYCRDHKVHGEADQNTLTDDMEPSAAEVAPAKSHPFSSKSRAEGKSS